MVTGESLPVEKKVGDKIIVLHSDEEGKVTEIINDKMVMIEVRVSIVSLTFAQSH